MCLFFFCNSLIFILYILTFNTLRVNVVNSICTMPCGNICNPVCPVCERPDLHPAHTEGDMDSDQPEFSGVTECAKRKLWLEAGRKLAEDQLKVARDKETNMVEDEEKEDTEAERVRLLQEAVDVKAAAEAERVRLLQEDADVKAAAEAERVRLLWVAGEEEEAERVRLLQEVTDVKAAAEAERP